VGVRTAEAMAAFIDDPLRFSDAKAVGCYFGPVPCEDQSGDKNRLGHITREGAAVSRAILAIGSAGSERGLANCPGTRLTIANLYLLQGLPRKTVGMSEECPGCPQKRCTSFQENIDLKRLFDTIY
jgi:hypothetical protein